MKIKIENISKKYKKDIILENVSFSLTSGTAVGILGENGCGKTTLLSCLAGITKADSGVFAVSDLENLSIDGKHIDKGESINLLSNSRLLTEFVGFVPQGFPFMNDLSARDNLKLWYNGSPSNLDKELTNGILKLLGIDEFASKKVSSLSGGMKKRLSIGCAMAYKPKILILDEVGASLDINCKQFILDYLDKYKKAGGSVIMTSHEESEISFCDNLYLIKNGHCSPYEYKGLLQLSKDME